MRKPSKARAEKILKEKYHQKNPSPAQVQYLIDNWEIFIPQTKKIVKKMNKKLKYD